MKRVLVLCTGNSCRSQMAEGYLRFYTREEVEIHSSGLENHGVNRYAVKVMEEDNIDISEQTSKTLEVFQGQHFDFLITVCDEASQSILQGIAFDAKVHFSIPDPAKVEGTVEQVLFEFREVRELVKRNMLKFIGQALYENTEATA